MNKILILEPSKSVRESLAELMELEGFTAVAAGDVAQGERCVVASLAERAPFDLMLVDGAVCERCGAIASLPFIVTSLAPSIDEAWRVAREGAVDYIATPFDMNRLLRSIRQHLAQRHDTECEKHPESVTRRKRATATPQQQIVGKSHEMTRLRTLIGKIAPSDARVLILGENGTGKELVARSIHHQSRRRDAPFVEVNCAAIPSELIESELFGHEKGAFTSAIKQRKGKFEQASGGTIFLDEVGDMSLSAQAKVLRALQESKICRVGSDKDIDVDVRVLAATNKDLRHEIDEGNFREDLYHRLGVIVVHVAPLRERADDIPLLAHHFLGQICREYDVEAKEITPEAMELLMARAWTGNIRELRNVVERLVVLSEGEIMDSDVELYC